MSGSYRLSAFVLLFNVVIASATQAEITSILPNGIIHSPPPATVGADINQDPTNVQGFDELQDIAAGGLTIPFDAGPVTLPAGAVVDSHFIWWDPPPPPVPPANATVTFDGPIVGIITSDQGLFNTHSNPATPQLHFGHPDVIYPGFTNSLGFEPGDIAGFFGQTMTLSANATSPGDFMRVITNPNSTAGTNEACYDFDIGPGLGWSANATTEIAPNGQSILGRFGNETVTLSLAPQHDHNFVAVTFDLHIIGPWAGVEGDAWSLTVAGTNVLDTTFSNGTAPPTLWPQDYPNSTPPVPRVAASGSSAIGALGYPTSVAVYGDVTYSLEFGLLYDAPTLQLDFAAALESATSTGETWALDNLCVTAYTVADRDERPGRDFGDVAIMVDSLSNPGPDDDLDGDGDADIGDVELYYFALEPLTVANGNPGDFNPGASVGNDGIAALLYDPNTGEVLVNTDGASINLFGVYSIGVFDTGNFTPLFGPDFLAASAFELGNLDGTLVGFTGLANLGAVLPAGLTQQQFEDLFVDALYVGAPGTGVNEFQFGLIPEPATLSIVLLVAPALLRLRRTTRT